MTKHPEAKFMQAALDLSAEAVGDNVGGPFGAIVVRDAEVIGRGRNRVHVYFANVREDAAAIGFDDEWLYRELDLLSSRAPCKRRK